jgi:hypothetical protein
MTVWLRATLIGAASLALACRGGKASPEPEPAPGEVGIEVQNQSSFSLTIYLVTGTVRRRLGQVNAQDALALVKPYSELAHGSSVYLRAEVIGSDDRVVTDDLRVQPGQIIQWILAPNLRMSRVVLH